MLVLVFDVPASSGGAVSVLNYYYEKAKEQTNDRYIFVLGKYHLNQTDNILVLNYPWIKRSWLHRLFFDVFYARRIIKKYKPNRIFSLQNLTIIGDSSIPQTLYMHQSIPFSDLKFSFFSEFKYWIIKNILGKAIIRSVRKSSQVIVQTMWIKDACISKAKIPGDKIQIEKPVFRFSTDLRYCNPKPLDRILFYPANGNSFKNHIVILKAVQLYDNKFNVKQKVVFTLSKEMGAYSKRIIREAKKRNVNVDFIGRISQEEVKEYYQKSILVFPSKLETLGLPLLEAKIIGCPIICSDKPFSREVLEGYDNAWFFDPDNEKDLAGIIEKLMLS